MRPSEFRGAALPVTGTNAFQIVSTDVSLIQSKNLTDFPLHACTMILPVAIMINGTLMYREGCYVNSTIISFTAHVPACLWQKSASCANAGHASESENSGRAVMTDVSVSGSARCGAPERDRREEWRPSCVDSSECEGERHCESLIEMFA